MLDVLVCIPAYNEAESIGRVVTDIKNALQGANYRILVVSDGSTDDTIRKAREAGAIAIHKPHSGLAGTFRREMEIAIALKPRVIVHTDADGQYDARDIRKLIAEIDNGHDLVLGSRLKGYIQYMPATKKMLNHVATLFIRVLVNRRVTDITTGFRAFNVSVAKLPIQSLHTYTAEQVIRASKAHYKIKSVPANFYIRKDGNSRLMKTSLHYLFETVKNVRRML